MIKILLAAIILTGCTAAINDQKIVQNIAIEEKQVNYYVHNLEKPFKAMFLADIHYTIEDERGEQFYDYSKRMGGAAVEPLNYGKSNGREVALMKSLEKAKKEEVQLVILGGDILNFPSLASAESLLEIMNESGLQWMYTAGNHDWHYEGEQGKPSELRAKWQATNLKPLYQGENPLYTSKTINGINFVTIDNSTFEITPEQLVFFKSQVDKKLPLILAMHIPIYTPERIDNIDYGCGHPNWNAKNDTYHQIERRIPWPTNGHTQTTYDFRKLVLGSDNIIGVYAGHTHKRLIDIHHNIFQYVVDSNFNGDDVIINFMNATQE